MVRKRVNFSPSDWTYQSASFWRKAWSESAEPLGVCKVRASRMMIE